MTNKPAIQEVAQNITNGTVMALARQLAKHGYPESFGEDNNLLREQIHMLVLSYIISKEPNAPQGPSADDLLENIRFDAEA